MGDLPLRVKKNVDLAVFENKSGNEMMVTWYLKIIETLKYTLRSLMVIGDVTVW